MEQVAWSAALKLLGAAHALFVLGVGGELLNSVQTAVNLIVRNGRRSRAVLIRAMFYLLLDYESNHNVVKKQRLKRIELPGYSA
ncbi:hypothetical protein [Desulfosporosinus sp.]|uniref:hypothetical protein n=1 Tax=Desulfosporosinus sp. TaxID=157907 RepID=UPI0025C604BF|nr:hypothetical protein [Desulfosporosinus sp.]MBC2722665.1 hypothetical protein [Desulfosporosinus sp.]